MASGDFNRFMEDYIDKRRSHQSPSFQDNKDKKKKYEEEKVPDGISPSSVYVIKKPKTFWQKLLEKFTSTDEEDFEEKPRKEVSETVESEQEFEQEFDEMKHDERKLTFFQRLMRIFSSKVEEEYQDLDDEAKIGESNPTKTYVEEYTKEPSQTTFFGKLLSMLGISVEVEDKGEEKVEEHVIDPSTQKMIEMREDLKEIAIIAVATFKKIPKEQFELVKNSSDFKKFKEILKKYNIIK